MEMSDSNFSHYTDADVTEGECRQRIDFKRSWWQQQRILCQPAYCRDNELHLYSEHTQFESGTDQGLSCSLSVFMTSLSGHWAHSEIRHVRLLPNTHVHTSALTIRSKTPDI